MIPVHGSIVPSHGYGHVAMVLIILGGGCQSVLDKDRIDIEKLRESVGTVQQLGSKQAIRPIDSDPDALAKLTKVEEQEARIKQIIEVLQTGSIREMPIAQCRKLTLTNNLDLQAAFIDPQMAQQSVLAEQAKFESTFKLSVMDTRTISPHFYQGNTSSTYNTDRLVVTPSLDVPLRTGGTVTLDWSVMTNDTVYTAGGASSATSNVNLNLQQPLLKDAWMDYNEASIVVAQASEGYQAASTQLTVVSTLQSAETAYWNVYLAWRNLEIQVEIYKRTKIVLDDARELVNLNQGSIANVFNFEVGLANSVSSVISAERDLRLAIRQLKATMQDPSISMDSTLALKPSSKPKLIAYDFDRQKLVNVAIGNRADLLQLEFEQVSDAVDILMAKNQMLPEVDLIAGYTWNGINSSDVSIRVATDNLFENNVQGGWRLGLTASVPIGNEIAIAAYQSALLKRLQSIANIRAQEILVTKEVLDAVDTLEAGWETILTTRFQVAAAQRNVDAMTSLFQIGERTSTDVSTAIFQLAHAQTSEASAEASYQIDLATLASATGCMLGHAGIEWGHYADLPLLEGSEGLPPPIQSDVADDERSDLSSPNAVPDPAKSGSSTESGTP